MVRSDRVSDAWIRFAYTANAEHTGGLGFIFHVEIPSNLSRGTGASRTSSRTHCYYYVRAYNKYACLFTPRARIIIIINIFVACTRITQYLCKPEKASVRARAGVGGAVSPERSANTLVTVTGAHTNGG